jgi:hypothetical protein
MPVVQLVMDATAPTLPPLVTTTVDPVIDPNGVYSKERLAAILGVTPRTVERMSGIDSGAVEAKAKDGVGSAGDLPPPFYVGRRPYWMGTALLQEFQRRQNVVIKTKGT